MTDLAALHDVTKAYAGVPALRGARLTIAPGEVHALVGENGAGKSTLIKILAGVTPPDAASIAIDGRSVSIDTPHAAADLGLRFIHQELDVVPALSVAENIFLGRRYPMRPAGFIDWRTLGQAATEAMGRLGITDIDPRRKMARLGLGDQMLVRLSAAFLDRGTAPARLYVMDEPTASLNGEETERLFRVLREIRDTGRSVLYVTHRLDEVMRLCDRVTVMRGGETISTAATSDTSEAAIIRDMIGRPVDEAYPRRATPVSDETVLDVDDLAGAGIGPVRLAVKAGEIVGLAGLSGAGQSEVLRLLMAADRRTGRVRVAAKPQQAAQPPQAWRSGLAYVPRERRSEGLMLTRSIAANVTLPHLRLFARGGFLNRGSEREAVSAAGDEVRLVARGPDQHCYKLSGGNQQKVLFARALLERPRILLLDEPTRGVDVGAKFDIYTLIREVSSRGTAILIASSDFPELLGMCDRIIVMRDGRIGGVLPAADLSEEDLLTHCYGHAAAAPATAAASGA